MLAPVSLSSLLRHLRRLVGCLQWLDWLDVYGKWTAAQGPQWAVSHGIKREYKLFISERDIIPSYTEELELLFSEGL